jgi:hypothetical protein
MARTKYPPFPLKKNFKTFQSPLRKVFSAGKEPKDEDGGKDNKKFGFFRGQFKVSHVIKTFTVWFHGHATQ